MNKTVPDNISVLLVEDNDDDAELTLRVFRQYHFANHIHVVRDGEEVHAGLNRRNLHVAVDVADHAQAHAAEATRGIDGVAHRRRSRRHQLRSEGRTEWSGTSHDCAE